MAEQEAVGKGKEHGKAADCDGSRCSRRVMWVCKLRNVCDINESMAELQIVMTAGAAGGVGWEAKM